jgi:hypothetical protein
MTPILHHAPEPRAVGSDLGGFGLHDRATKGARQFGSEGDVCQRPGCICVLSRYNPLDRCSRHPEGGKKRPQRRRGSASALREAQTTAAPEPRRVTREEIEMAAAQRQEMSEAKKAVLAALTDTYDTAPRIAERAGVKEALCYYHLKRLVDNGHAEHKLGKGGGYRARHDAVAEAAEAARALSPSSLEAKPEPPSEPPQPEAEPAQAAASEDEEPVTAPTPLGAAPDGPPEQPAGPAAPVPPGPPQESPWAGTMPPPFAGGVDPRCFETPAWSAPFGQFLEAQPVRYMHSDEVECMARLERLADDARERVLTWGNSRWPIAREVFVHVDCAPSAEAMAEAVLGLVKGAGQ